MWQYCSHHDGDGNGYIDECEAKKCMVEGSECGECPEECGIPDKIYELSKFCHEEAP